MNEFYVFFDGFNKDVINLAMGRLRKKEKEFICDYYGLNGFRKLKIGELVEKYGVSPSSIRQKRRVCMDKIKSILLNPKAAYSNNERFYQMYSKYNIEDVLYSLSYLSFRCKRVLELYYGLNGNEELDMKDIAIKCNTDINSVNSALIYGNDRLSGILEEIHSFEPEFDVFNRNLDGIKNNLSEESKKIIDVYYASSSARQFFYVITKNFNVNYNDAKRLVKKCVKEVRKEMLNLDRGNKGNIIFNQQFGNYSLEQINAVLDLFGEKRKDMFSRYYGINGYKCMGTKDIAKEFNVSMSWVNFAIKRDSEKLKFLLENPNAIDLKVKYAEDFFGYDKSMVEKVLVKFSPNHEKLLSVMYGFNGSKVLSKGEVCSQYNIDQQSLYRILKVSVLRIKEILDDGRFNDKFLKYDSFSFRGYLETLPIIEREIITRHYGLFGYLEEDLDEIARNLSVDPISIGAVIKDIEKEMDTNLASFELLNRKEKNRKLFLNKLIVKDKIKIKKALSLLSEKEEKALFMYYGLSGVSKINKKEIALMLKIRETEVDDEVARIVDKMNDNLYEICYSKGKKNK